MSLSRDALSQRLRNYFARRELALEPVPITVLVLATLEAEEDLPDVTAIIQTLMLRRDFIMSNQMIYPIVDNRMPADVPYWPAFAEWWASCRCLVGTQEEATDILWVCADATAGLHKIPCKGYHALPLLHKHQPGTVSHKPPFFRTIS